MIAVVQRVTESSVSVYNKTIGKIGPGLVVLLGVSVDDKPDDAVYLAHKITGLRIFEDDEGKMNRSILEVGGEMLVVSQFTLLGDCRKGRRPSFISAAKPEIADRLYHHFVQCIRQHPIRVETGRFQAMMQVALINDGPVTLIVKSKHHPAL